MRSQLSALYGNAAVASVNSQSKKRSSNVISNGAQNSMNGSISIPSGGDISVSTNMSNNNDQMNSNSLNGSPLNSFGSPVTPYDAFLMQSPTTAVSSVENGLLGATAVASFGTISTITNQNTESIEPEHRESENSDEIENSTAPDEDEIKFEEDLVPSSLMDLLSSQELKRKLAKNEDPVVQENSHTESLTSNHYHDFLTHSTFDNTGSSSANSNTSPPMIHSNVINGSSSSSSSKFQFFTPTSSAGATTVGFSPVNEFKPLNFSLSASNYNVTGNAGGLWGNSGGVDNVNFPKTQARHSFGSNASSSSTNSMMNQHSPNLQQSTMFHQQSSPNSNYIGGNARMIYSTSIAGPGLTGSSANYHLQQQDDTQKLIQGINSLGLKK